MKFKSKPTKSLRFILALLFIVFLILSTNILDLKGYQAKVEELGYWAPLGIFLLRFTSVILPALPSTAYSILSGALLGFKKGIIIICLSDLFACTLSFFISRYFGRDLVKLIVGEKFISKVEDFSSKNIENNFLLMTGLLMTGLFDFVCYGIGLTKIPWIKFAPALLISIALSNPPIVALGSGVLEGGKAFLIFAAVGVLILGLIINRIKSLDTIKNSISNNLE